MTIQEMDKRRMERDVYEITHRMGGVIHKMQTGEEIHGYDRRAELFVKPRHGARKPDLDTQERQCR